MSSAPDAEKPSAASWIADHISSQVGRTFVVTGANSGLGLETVRALGSLGANVIMTARDRSKGQRALEELLEEQPEAKIELGLLDLADLDSVHEFAATLGELDVLINNAGVMMPPHGRTRQGFELQFGVNHLGHFALTGLLLDRLARSHDGRVVTVSSNLHKRGRIHFDDIHGEQDYGRTKYYAQSKLANVVFAIELNRRLRANGLPVRSVLAHPGYSATNLQSSGPTGVGKLFMKAGNRLFAQDAEMGSLPQLYAATGADVESGQFYGPDGRGESKGFPTLVEPLDDARDRELGKRLWDISEKLTGVAIPLSR
ncbi:MAG TPA: oxidoreductase [Actinophytocola sp.]|jgi:NAD(P)-dependent dehydrogenase (short-subunit alcohol dehydrogenase family)|uniref:oxidoreductase n=1 Tax=Actinophytocola sp. TaxID=1872138 RepID=UPI002F91CAA6